MTEKAKVVVQTPFGEREYELSSGDKLAVEAFAGACVTLKEAKGPQPERARKGWAYRWSKDEGRYLYRPADGKGSGWCQLASGNIGTLDVGFLRFLADLREATEKWHAS